MPQVLHFILFALSCTGSVTCSIVFARAGEDATLSCQCSKNHGCYKELVRWVRMNSNETLQIIDTKCEKSPCRFTSKRTDDIWVALTILQVESGDSGRYYCGEHLSSYLQFTDNGTVLTVGDVWTNSSELHLLNEWTGEGGSPELDWSEAQTSNSSQEFMSKWRYRVESQLRIGLKVKSDWEDEYEYEHEYGYLDKMVEMDEELWCEVQVGVNVSVQSPKFSFRQQTHTDSEWCNGVLYGEIAFCVLCVCLLTLLICHCLRHQHKGSEPSATEASPTLNSCRDVSSDITYAHLDIRKQPKTERRQRQKSRQKNSQEDRLVYSEVRYKCEDRVLHG
ncbi:uncharacterized protein LOC135233445 isoform X7 [Anguilla rostrata]|uniref:uncharacterized protein LOC135233445 isoform X7 n=1 Tax=Anguilla rostrata TaxID=7938 RepID=UPI0030CBFFAB